MNWFDQECLSALWVLYLLLANRLQFSDFYKVDGLQQLQSSKEIESPA